MPVGPRTAVDEDCQLLTRRHFLHTTAIAAATLAPSRARGGVSRSVSQGPEPEIAGVEFRELAAQAVDAARRAGATYADVRLTHERVESLGHTDLGNEGEALAVGIRALVNGYWGFSSSTEFTPDEITRLAVGAVTQARAYSRIREGRARELDIQLDPIPVVSDGHWTMPVMYDPFEIPGEEKLDVMGAARAYAERYAPGIQASGGMSFRRCLKVCASTEG